MLHPKKEVSKLAVELCQRIYDGSNQPAFVAYYLEYLCFHLPEKRLEPALSWLLIKGIRGAQFMEYVVTECDNSGLEFLRHVTRGIERDTELRRIYGKDLIA